MSYCRSTPKCRKSCLAHALVKDPKISSIQRRNSSRVAWKEVDQQYSGGLCTPEQKDDTDNTRNERTL